MVVSISSPTTRTECSVGTQGLEQWRQWRTRYWCTDKRILGQQYQEPTGKIFINAIQVKYWTCSEVQFQRCVDDTVQEVLEWAHFRFHFFPSHQKIYYGWKWTIIHSSYYSFFFFYDKCLMQSSNCNLPVLVINKKRFPPQVSILFQKSGEMLFIMFHFHHFFVTKILFDLFLAPFKTLRLAN